MPDDPKKGVPGGWSRPDPADFDPDEFGPEPDPSFEWKTDEPETPTEPELTPPEEEPPQAA